MNSSICYSAAGYREIIQCNDRQRVIGGSPCKWRHSSSPQILLSRTSLCCCSGRPSGHLIFSNDGDFLRKKLVRRSYSVSEGSQVPWLRSASPLRSFTKTSLDALCFENLQLGLVAWRTGVAGPNLFKTSNYLCYQTFGRRLRFTQTHVAMLLNSGWFCPFFTLDADPYFYTC